VETIRIRAGREGADLPALSLDPASRIARGPNARGIEAARRDCRRAEKRLLVVEGMQTRGGTHAAMSASID
jgi:hypothetical protein